MMTVTVILCTHNRCQLLRQALDSIATSKLPQSVVWEVLVVDNNSADRTSEVAKEFCSRYPEHFRYLFEPRPGKTYALNAGIHEARGEILVFTDDDVTVDPMWLRNLTATVDNGGWAGASGRTLPERGFEPPRWLPPDNRYAFGPLAIFDLGSKARELTEAPFGNNMAFRRAVFEKHGAFRIDLGPRACSPGPQKSEDSEFGTRLLAAGERFFYEPSAIVYHSVPKSRIRKEYFLKWWFDKGRADIQAFGVPRDTKWYVGGIPLYLFRRLLAWIVRWTLTFEPRRRFDCKLKVWRLAGEILEFYRQPLAARRQKQTCNP